MPSRNPPNSPCPCDSGRAYARCCGPLHAGAAAADAESPMRSRYSAYALGLEPYLLETWHPSTRPAALGLVPGQPRWLGLSVSAHRPMATDRAEVEFVARFRVGGGRAERLHERSRFVREADRWFYLDGDLAPD